MASLTLRGLNDRFPEGTSLGAYPLSNWTPGQQPAAGTAPVGSATATASVSSDAVTLTGLADDTAYIVTDSAGTKFLRAFTSLNHGQPVKTDSNGKVPWALLAGSEVNVRDAAYGAKADGTTDDTAAIQAAANSGAIRVKCPAGTYYIATGITLPSGVELVGDGIGQTIFTCADVASIAVSCVGTSAAVTNLTTDLTEGSLTADLTSVAGLAAGDLLYLNASSDVNLGSWVPRVRSIASNTVTFDEPSPAAFTVAQGARAYSSATWKRRVGVEGISFRNAAASPTTRQYFVKFAFADEARVERCEFVGLGSTSCAAVYASNSRSIRVVGNEFDNIQFDNTSTGVVDFDGVTEASVAQNRSRNSSGGVSLFACPRSVVANNRLTGAGAVSRGRGVKLHAGCNYTVVSSNMLANFGDGSHTNVHCVDSWGCAITGNTIHKGGSIAIGASGGVAGRTHHNSVTGNVLRKIISTPAITVQPPNVTDQVYTVISGNTISATAGNAYAIDVQASSCLVVGNIIDGYNSLAAGIAIRGVGVFDSYAIGNHVTNGGSGNSIIVSNPTGLNAAVSNYMAVADFPAYAGGVASAPIPRVNALTYSASITPRPFRGPVQTINVTNGTAFTINLPDPIHPGMEITFDIKNSSGGAMGVITWNAAFKFDATGWTNPANGKRRTVRFYYDGTNLIQVGPVSADI